MLTTYPNKITLEAGHTYQFRFVKKLNIKVSVNFANYRMYFTDRENAPFVEQPDGSWRIGGVARAGYNVELRFDRTTIMWSLDVS